MGCVSKKPAINTSFFNPRTVFVSQKSAKDEGRASCLAPEQRKTKSSGQCSGLQRAEKRHTVEHIHKLDLMMLTSMHEEASTDSRRATQEPSVQKSHYGEAEVAKDLSKLEKIIFKQSLADRRLEDSSVA